MDVTLRDGTVLTGKAAQAYNQAIEDARIVFQNHALFEDDYSQCSIARAPLFHELQKEAASWADEYWPDRPAEIHMIKLMEEAGELAETFTKVQHHLSSGKKLDQAAELADVVIVAMVLANKLGIELDDEVAKKLNHNRKTKTPASLDARFLQGQADFNFSKSQCNRCGVYGTSYENMERHFNRHMKEDDS